MRGPAARLLLAFGLVSLAAVALGAWVCAASGVPSGSWIRNLLAWAVGGAAAVGLAYRPIMLPAALAAAPFTLAAAFLFPDQQGVHRWLDLGPVHANAAMLALPAAVVALASLAQRRWAWALALVGLGLLVAQPDASQAAAWGAATAWVVAVGAWGDGPLRMTWQRFGMLALTLGLVILGWTRPDPLQPAPGVEGVVGLARALSPVAGLGAILLLFGVAIAPARATSRCDTRVKQAGAALGLLLLFWGAMPLFGAFPVPFLGIGMSPIFGAWLGVGLLAGLSRTGEAGRVA